MRTLARRYARHLRHLWAQGSAAIDHHHQMNIAFAIAQRIMEDRWQGRRSLVATLRMVAEFENCYGSRAMGLPWNWRNSRGKRLMDEREARYALAHVPEAPAYWNEALKQTATHPVL